MCSHSLQRRRWRRSRPASVPETAVQAGVVRSVMNWILPGPLVRPDLGRAALGSIAICMAEPLSLLVLAELGRNVTSVVKNMLIVAYK